MKRYIIMLTALAAAFLIATPAYAATGGVVYNSIPTAMTGNVASLGYQATQTSEFGDGITFAANAKKHLMSVKVVMSSWGCEAIALNGNCVTTPGDRFNQPITFNIYALETGTPPGAVVPGALIATTTQTFAIKYRPSTNTNKCPNTLKWWSKADNACYSGLAQTITFNFGSQHLLLPSNIVYGIAYNTSGYGANPYGYATACSSSAAGCAYASLNVGAEATTPFKGTDRFLDGVFYDTSTAGWYCDGGAAGSGFFRLDDAPGCWTVNNPMVRFQNH